MTGQNNPRFGDQSLIEKQDERRWPSTVERKGRMIVLRQPVIVRKAITAVVEKLLNGEASEGQFAGLQASKARAGSSARTPSFPYGAIRHHQHVDIHLVSSSCGKSDSGPHAQASDHVH
jgi:hypothetical protein